MTRSTNDRHALAATVLLSALSGWTPSAAQSIETPPVVDSPSFTTDGFSLRKSDGSFLLHVKQDGKETLANIPTSWLVPPRAAKAEEDAYVSSFNYNQRITSFPIGNSWIGLHLSSFDFMTDGSAQAAAGRDVFLVYDPRTARIERGLTTLGITKSRVRDEGCFHATGTHFILADINRDGLLDLGMVEEAIRCDESSSGGEYARPVQPHFVQQPVQWFVWQHRHWRAAPRLRGQFPTRIAALPLIGMEFSPIDYVGYRYWKTHDAARWEVQSQHSVLYRAPYRETLVRRTVERKTDKPESMP